MSLMNCCMLQAGMHCTANAQTVSSCHTNFYKLIARPLYGNLLIIPKNQTIYRSLYQNIDVTGTSRMSERAIDYNKVLCTVSWPI